MPENLPTPPTLNLDAAACQCEQCTHEVQEKIAESLAKLADIKEMQFFGSVLSSDADAPERGDTLQMTVPLLIKLLEWSRETAKDDKSLHIMVETLYEESNFGSRILTTRDYTGDAPSYSIGDAFKEQEHPRGQPENSGEFVEKVKQQHATNTQTRQNVPQSRQDVPEAVNEPTTPTLVKAKVVAGKLWSANGTELPQHIQAAKLPPAWTNVEYSNDPHAKLLATGLDAKGRKQYVYNKAFSSTQAEAKFAKIKELAAKFHEVVAENEQNRTSSDERIADAANCIALVMSTGIRPGSEEDTGAKEQAYGATTLQGQHVVVTKTGVSLKFTGKKGVALNIPVNDVSLQKMLIQRKVKAGDTGQLFRVTDKQLRLYSHTLDGGHYKTKDYRTLLGTMTAMDEVKSMPVPKNDAERKKSILSVAKIVSTKLGNTPTVALQSYIAPEVFSVWGNP